MSEIWHDAEDIPSCVTAFYDVDVICPFGSSIHFGSCEVKQCVCGKIYRADLRIFEKVIPEAQEECDEGTVNFVQNFGDWLNKQ